jgi:hypothetical protein
MVRRNIRRRRATPADVAGLAAMVGGAVLICYGAFVLLFTDSYPALPDSPLPPIRMAAGFVSGNLPLVAPWSPLTTPGGSGLRAFGHPVALAEAKAVDVAWLASLPRGWRTRARTGGGAARGAAGFGAATALGSLAEDIGAASAETDDTYAQEAAVPQASLFTAPQSDESSLWGSPSASGLVMEHPFGTRSSEAPYALPPDVQDELARGYSSYPLTSRYAGGPGWASGFWSRPDLSKMRYRTYVREGEPFLSPFLDTFGDGAAAGIGDLGSGLTGSETPFAAQLNGDQIEEPWLDNPLYAVPR